MSEGHSLSHLYSLLFVFIHTLRVTTFMMMGELHLETGEPDGEAHRWPKEKPLLEVEMRDGEDDVVKMANMSVMWELE